MRAIVLIALLALAACAAKPTVPVCPPGDQSNTCTDRDGSNGTGPNDGQPESPPELVKRRG